MYQIKNFMENDDVKVIDSLGAFSVVEYQRDLSVMPETAMEAFYASQMNVRKRQVVCDVSKSNVTVQAGAMQSNRNIPETEHWCLNRRINIFCCWI